MLFAAGAVAGEALVGVGVALLVGMGITTQSADYPYAGLVSLVAALALVAIFSSATRPRRG